MLHKVCRRACLSSTAAAATASRCLHACCSAVVSSFPGPYRLASKTLSTCVTYIHYELQLTLELVHCTKSSL